MPEAVPLHKQQLLGKPAATLAADIGAVVRGCIDADVFRMHVRQWATELTKRRATQWKYQEERDKHARRAQAKARWRNREAGPPKDGWRWEHMLVPSDPVYAWGPPDSASAVVWPEREDMRATISVLPSELGSDHPLVLEAQRIEHLRRVRADARLRDKAAGPPEDGWKWQSFALPPTGIWGWVPAELAADKEPDTALPLPLPPGQSGRKLSLAEKGAVLAAFHDGWSKGAAQLNPWNDAPKSRDDLPFRELIARVRQIEADDEPHLRALLNELAIEFGALLQPAQTTGTSTPGDRAAQFLPLEDDVKLLRALQREGTALVQVDLAAEANLGLTTVKKLLPTLRKAGLVQRPNGKRQGDAITERGRKFLDTLTPKASNH